MIFETVVKIYPISDENDLIMEIIHRTIFALRKPFEHLFDEVINSGRSFGPMNGRVRLTYLSVGRIDSTREPNEDLCIKMRVKMLNEPPVILYYLLRGKRNRCFLSLDGKTPSSILKVFDAVFGDYLKDWRRKQKKRGPFILVPKSR